MIYNVYHNAILKTLVKAHRGDLNGVAAALRRVILSLPSLRLDPARLVGPELVEGSLSKGALRAKGLVSFLR
jgi:hypothetical protein